MHLTWSRFTTCHRPYFHVASAWLTGCRSFQDVLPFGDNASNRNHWEGPRQWRWDYSWMDESQNHSGEFFLMIWNEMCSNFRDVLGGWYKLRLGWSSVLNLHGSCSEWLASRHTSLCCALVQDTPLSQYPSTPMSMTGHSPVFREPRQNVWV